MASNDAEEAQVPLGLLDQPVVVEGKRKRKAAQQFNIETTAPKKRVAVKHVGSGTKLQDIPSVDHALSEKFRVDDLRMLYKLCFGVNGKAATLKKELKQFKGFEFDKDSGEYKKKIDYLKKLSQGCLTGRFCAPLCLHDKGKKEQLADRIMEFLLCPTDSGTVTTTAVKEVKRKKAQQQKKKEKKTEKKPDADEQKTVPSTLQVDATEETKSLDEPTTTDATKDEENDHNKEE